MKIFPFSSAKWSPIYIILLIRYKLTWISYGSSISKNYADFYSNLAVLITVSTSFLSANDTKFENIWHNYILILIFDSDYNINISFYVIFELYNKFVEGTFSNTKLEIAQHASLRKSSSLKDKNG